MYKNLPIWLQDACVSLKGLQIAFERFGQDFKKAYFGYMERAHWDEDQIYLYQEIQRIEALKRAANAPYYRKLFSQLGATYNDFIKKSVFETLPIIKKSDLQNNIEQFRCRHPAPEDQIIMTSGTTGKSLSLPVSKNVEVDQWALWWRYWHWHGIKRKEKCALFASTPIVYGEKTVRPYRLNYANNEIRFSIFHISPESAQYYVEALNKYKPTWVHGNPTAISLLGKYIFEQELKISFSIRRITLGSENILPWQREAIISAFGIQPRQHYGLAEAVANISECEAGRLHVDEDYSYVEFIPEKENESCAIIGTAFTNTAVSLLRYNTGDLGKISKIKCECGRPGRIVESLDGRLTDYVVLPGGRRVASLAAPFHSTECLAGAQLYQSKDGKITVRYIPGPGWKNEFLAGLESRLRKRIGDKIPLTFEEVKEITKTARGKTKLVVSDYVEP